MSKIYDCHLPCSHVKICLHNLTFPPMLCHSQNLRYCEVQNVLSKFKIIKYISSLTFTPPKYWNSLCVNCLLWFKWRFSSSMWSITGMQSHQRTSHSGLELALGLLSIVQIVWWLPFWRNMTSLSVFSPRTQRIWRKPKSSLNHTPVQPGKTAFLLLMVEASPCFKSLICLVRVSMIESWDTLSTIRCVLKWA